jgi:hypothetical protein
VEDAVEVYGHHPPPVGEVVALQRHGGADDAGVVDQNVDPAQRRQQPVAARLDRGRVGDVHALGQRAADRPKHRAVEVPQDQLGPPSASRAASARPMPPAPPVTSATLPAKS